MTFYDQTLWVVLVILAGVCFLLYRQWALTRQHIILLARGWTKLSKDLSSLEEQYQTLRTQFDVYVEEVDHELSIQRLALMALQEQMGEEQVA